MSLTLPISHPCLPIPYQQISLKKPLTSPKQDREKGYQQNLVMFFKDLPDPDHQKQCITPAPSNHAFFTTLRYLIKGT